MDWLTFIAEIVKAIAWPVFLLFAVLILRKPLIELIPALRRLRYKEFEIEFSRELLDVERRVKALPTAAPGRAGVAVTGLDRLRHIAAVAPAAAILEGWRDLEAAAADVTSRRGLTVAGGTWQLFFVLQSEGVLSEAQASVVDRLRRLRNKVAHAHYGEINEEHALRYVELAAGLAAAIREAS